MGFMPQTSWGMGQGWSRDPFGSGVVPQAIGHHVGQMLCTAPVSGFCQESAETSMVPKARKVRVPVSLG